MSTRRQRGFSLVELMIGSTLGIVVLGAAGSVFINSSQNYRQDESLAFLQDELGFAMTQLVRDVEMAGFWGEVHDAVRISSDGSLTIARDCGAGNAAWTYEDRSALSVVNNVGLTPAASAESRHSCLDDDAIRAGSDLIAVKRVVGRATAPADLVAGQVYLRTGALSGTLFQHGSSTPATPAGHTNWEFRPSIYYIRNYSISPTEQPLTPALCRRTLTGGTPSFEADECLARGVENLQVEIGVDADDDGIANYFVSAPSRAELTRATSARVYLLARSLSANYQARSDTVAQKFFEPGGDADTFTPEGDEKLYYRRTLTTDVVLRNPRALRGVAIR